MPAVAQRAKVWTPGCGLCQDCLANDALWRASKANGEAWDVCDRCREQSFRLGVLGITYVQLSGARPPAVVPSPTTAPEWEGPQRALPPVARPWLPDFDGATYERERDLARLTGQLRRVADVLSDGLWHTLAGIAKVTLDPEASISARIRDLRKGKFGGWTVEHRNVGGGLWEYRLRRGA